MIEAEKLKPLPDVPAEPAPPEPAAPNLLRLDLACGQRKKEGFVGVDFKPIEGVDRVFDLLSFPWPLEDESVDEIYCAHFFEHVPGAKRFAFMDEVYRVLKTGCRALFVCPFYNGSRAIQDPTHEWPPICEASFLYFDARWRKAQGLDHYDVKCDFETIHGHTFFPDLDLRAEDYKGFATRHYTNAVMDIHASMVKR